VIWVSQVQHGFEAEPNAVLLDSASDVGTFT
jgi:hypothetical protein